MEDTLVVMIISHLREPLKIEKKCIKKTLFYVREGGWEGGEQGSDPFTTFIIPLTQV